MIITNEIQHIKRTEYCGQIIHLYYRNIPSYCIANGQNYYLYVAVDKCSMWTFREIYCDHTVHTSLDFIKKIMIKFPCPIREVWTNCGAEWTNFLVSNKTNIITLFEQYLIDNYILHYKIMPPKNRNKTDSQILFNNDVELFFKKMRMYNFEDGRKQIQKFNRLYNSMSKYHFGAKPPNSIIQDYMFLM